MTPETALVLFAMMPNEQQARVARIFDLTRAAFPNVRIAFAQAVMDECEDIETEMLLAQPVWETALRILVGFVFFAVGYASGVGVTLYGVFQ